MTLASPRPHVESLPSPRASADFLFYGELLAPNERARLDRAITMFREVVRPVVAGHWAAATFPFELLPALARENLVSVTAGGASHLLHGFLHLELSRVDLSMSTFLGVHELSVSAIDLMGSDEQRAALLPGLRSLTAIGAFGLTEPEHGSDISRAMQTTATRDGDHWILDGAKRWIGNGTFADHVCIWARDTADDTMRGFIVDRGTPGFTTRVIDNKIALRIVQNANIDLDHVRVSDSARLSGAQGFRDANTLLTKSRIWVAWQAVGLQFAAYDLALAYALERTQFSKPIASFQLTQNKLVRLLENATASLGTMVRIAQLQDDERIQPEHAAMAKASCTERMRESVAMARSIFGGNGISTDYDIARVFADAEAVYSYEGSYEINTLVVGRAITGISAFS
jgi:glutaryl-CoA dehydrogenase